MPKPTVENVEVHFDGNCRSLSCEYGGACYHIWLDSDNKPIDSTLYKNPPSDVGAHEAGFYTTRRLSTDSKFAGGLVASMMAVVKEQDLFRKALIAEQERVEQERLAEEASDLADRKRASAGEMFDLLQKILYAGHLETQAGDLRTRVVELLTHIHPAFDARVQSSVRGNEICKPSP